MSFDYDRWAFWALDLCRATSHRPWWARLLFWLALGESGRHEFWGLVWAIDKDGWAPFADECEYRSHIGKMPLLWRGVSPINPEWNTTDRAQDEKRA